MEIRITRGTWDQRVAPYEYVTRHVGDVVDVDDEDAHRLISGGTAVDAATPMDTSRPTVAEKATDIPARKAPKKLPKKPRRAASKADWVAYAEAIGVPIQRADGTDMEKNQLIVAVEARLAELD